MDSTTEEMVRRISQIPDELGASACFGKPVERDGRTLIPVARVTFGYGMGFGRGSGSEGAAGNNGAGSDGGEGEGGGGGGGGSSSPVAVIDVTGDRIQVEPIIDRTRIAMSSFALSAWIVFWLFWTVRTAMRERSRIRRREIEKGAL